MRRSIGTVVLALSLALTLTAGAADEASRVAEAERKVAELVKGYQAAEEAMQDRLAEMRKGEEYTAAREAQDFQKLQALTEAIRKPVVEEWRAKFTDAARPFDGGEGEVVFAAAMLDQWLVEDPAPVIIGVLEEYPKSLRLPPILDASPRLARSPHKAKLRAVLGGVIAENPDGTVRAHAHFARAQATAYDKEATDAEKAEAEADRARVLELVPESSVLSMRVRGPEYERTRLQVGMTAPDIEGPDLFGKTFRLSDYRGKVVMLDFWGDW